ncbi:hypothetical protein K502DRAFT_362842 [Neoconidiobolus thromboides FSU 785]|nr:hypothetical protein K502DRAFT_362842 [Neoconidiobolus thromboides FSU 785]
MKKTDINSLIINIMDSSIFTISIICSLVFNFCLSSIDYLLAVLIIDKQLPFTQQYFEANKMVGIMCIVLCGINTVETTLRLIVSRNEGLKFKIIVIMDLLITCFLFFAQLSLSCLDRFEYIPFISSFLIFRLIFVYLRVSINNNQEFQEIEDDTASLNYCMEQLKNKEEEIEGLNKLIADFQSKLNSKSTIYQTTATILTAHSSETY